MIGSNVVQAHRPWSDLGGTLVPPSGPPPDGAVLLDDQLRDHPCLAVPVDVADDLVGPGRLAREVDGRSEEHTSELQSLMRISYAVFCLKKKKKNNKTLDVRTHRQDKAHK